MTVRASSMLALFLFLSLSACARAQFAGTWVMTGSPLNSATIYGTWLHDEYTALDVSSTTPILDDARGIGKSRHATEYAGTRYSETNVTRYFNATDAGCSLYWNTNETTYGAKFSSIDDLSSRSFWGNTSGPGVTYNNYNKYWHNATYWNVNCGYATYDYVEETVTWDMYFELHVYPSAPEFNNWEPGDCPKTKEEAARGISWMPSNTGKETFTYTCVANCQKMDKNEIYPWEVLNCDNVTSVSEMKSGVASSSVASATQTNSIEYFASTDGTCTGTHGDLSSDNSLFRWAASSGSCSSYDSWSPPLPSTWPTKGKYLKFTCSATDVTFYSLCSEGCATSTCVDTITAPKSEVWIIGKCMDQANAGYPDYKIYDSVGCDDYSGAGTLSYLASACTVTALLLLV
jgi:hypothetical protein